MYNQDDFPAKPLQGEYLKLFRDIVRHHRFPANDHDSAFFFSTLGEVNEFLEIPDFRKFLLQYKLPEGLEIDALRNREMNFHASHRITEMSSHLAGPEALTLSE
jgi:hypothetical protein